MMNSWLRLDGVIPLTIHDQVDPMHRLHFRFFDDLKKIVILLFLSLPWACSSSSETSNGSWTPKVTPEVQLNQLEITPPSGKMPLDVDVKVQILTGDPRADVKVFVDYGDNNQDEEILSTSLPEVLDPNNAAEEEPEIREVHFQHTYVQDGTYKVQVHAMDLTHSKDLPEDQAIVSKILEQEVVVEALPDLLVVKVQADTQILEPETPFHISYQVYNSGVSVPRPFKNALYLVKDPLLTAESLEDPTVSLFLTTDNAPPEGLAQEGSLDREIEIQLSLEDYQALSEGIWYPAVIVDMPNPDNPSFNIAEMDEENNFKVGETEMIREGEKEKPDLVVSNLTVTPTSTTILQNIEINFQVTNQGGQPSPLTEYRVYLSKNDDQWDEDDRLLGSGNVRALEPEESIYIPALQYEIDPAILQPSTYYVIVKIDPDDQLSETVEGETNNTTVSLQSIEVTGATQREMDIAVSNLQVTPDSTYIDGQVEVRFQATNLGSDELGRFICRIYTSPDNVWAPEDDKLVAQLTTESLIPNEVEDYYWIITFPQGAYTAGDYYIFVICDPDNLVVELDETNNFLGPSDPIQVKPYADVDYQIESVTLSPLSVDMEDPQNREIQAEVSICNHGTDVAYAPLVKLYLSLDQTISTEDLLIGGHLIEDAYLQPNACSTAYITATADCYMFEAQYYVGVIVDPENLFVESQEDNNVLLIQNQDQPVEIHVSGSKCICTDDAYDQGTQNNTPETASDLTSLFTPTGFGNQSVAHVTDLAYCGTDPNEVDNYQVHLNFGDTLTANLHYDEAYGDLDLKIYDVDDPENTVQISEDEGGSETASLITYRDDATVIVEVYPKNPGVDNYYELELYIQPSPVEPDLEVSEIRLLSGTIPFDYEHYDFEVEIQNHGITTVEVPVRVYLSSSQYYNPNSPPQYLITDPNQDAVLTVPRMGSATLSFEDVDFLEIYPDIPPDIYYIIVVIDPDQQVMEFDENNNVTVSDGISIDTGCVADAYEGDQGNESFDQAYVIRPALNVIDEHPDLNVCNLNRSDYYLICVPTGTPLNHIGILEQTPNQALRATLYQLDQSSIRTFYSATNPLISTGVPPSTCVSDNDCFGNEYCQPSGYCGNDQGEHCLYLKVANLSSSIHHLDYTLLFDTANPLSTDEPINDERETAIPLPSGLRTLNADEYHDLPKNDADWYRIDLPANLPFTVNLYAADRGLQVRYYIGDAATGTAILPYQTRDFITTADGPIYFKVYTAYAAFNPTSGYVLEVQGIDGVDLIPRLLSVVPSSVSRRASVWASWSLYNGRLDASDAPVSYRYFISQDPLLDSSDLPLYALGESSTDHPLDGLEQVDIAQKVYLLEDTGSGTADLPESYIGDYYLLVEVNPEINGSRDNVEENYDNNVIATPLHLDYLCDDDPYEPDNDDPSTAMDLDAAISSLPYESEQLSLCVADVDYFKVTIPQDATYVFEIHGMRDLDDGDLDLFLYERNGNDLGEMLGFSADYGTLTETITYHNDSGADLPVYLKVQAFQVTYSNIYWLSVAVQ